MSYTKGQWHPVLSSDGTIIFDDDDKRIAFVDSREDSDNYELENARLMCAAPDMYEALKNALWHLSPNHNEGHATIRTDELLSTIRQALSKAEGIS